MFQFTLKAMKKNYFHWSKWSYHVTSLPQNTQQVPLYNEELYFQFNSSLIYYFFCIHLKLKTFLKHV